MPEMASDENYDGLEERGGRTRSVVALVSPLVFKSSMSGVAVSVRSLCSVRLVRWMEPQNGFCGLN